MDTDNTININGERLNLDDALAYMQDFLRMADQSLDGGRSMLGLRPFELRMLRGALGKWDTSAGQRPTASYGGGK